MNTTRHITASITKAASASYDGTFVLSDESLDRTGDIIRVDGWQLAAFKKNPIALWQHDSYNPIGSWKNIRIEGKRLIGDLKLATTALANTARTLISEGVLKAVSVGLRVLEYEPIDEREPYGGWEIKKSELMEVSLVSVPANQNALLISKRFNLSEVERKLIFATPGQSPGQPPPAASGIHPSVQRALDAREAVRKIMEKRS